MAAPEAPRFDKNGLPIPVKLDARGYGSETDYFPTSRRPSPLLKFKRPILFFLLIGVLAALIGPALLRDIGNGIAIRCVREAEQLADRELYPEAQAKLAIAEYWGQRNARLLLRCARCRLLAKDPRGCLANCEAVLKFPKVTPDDRRWINIFKLQAHQQLREWDQAIAAASEMIELGDAQQPDPWNTRAYMRALANRELEAGLTDVEMALKLLRQKNLAAGSLDEAMYLDTRGYLLFRLGKLGAALSDMDQAISIVEQVKALERFGEDPFGSPQDRLGAELKEAIAVMTFHRAEILRAMGRVDEADEQDARARRLGYDPENGVE